ncbi:MAG: hypothetical protein CMJ31_02090 [Phycisphaerae bacterium]|nr:hypothetical protein [Phycisphaerae bacterium]|tara:strand:+ start:253 stop:561 length:309 start_codon:yes stop_codon:yes gene_type:complete
MTFIISQVRVKFIAGTTVHRWSTIDGDGNLVPEIDVSSTIQYLEFEERCGGWYLYMFANEPTSLKDCVADDWYPDKDDALHQAEEKYGVGPDDWYEVERPSV